MQDLKFKDKYIEQIVKGNKRTTWRVDHEEVFRPGRTILLKNTNGNSFAKAEVKWYKYTTIDSMSGEDFKYRTSSDTTAGVVNTLQKLYPEHDVVVETEISVIRYDVKELV